MSTARARQLVASRFGADLGFDLGHEGFSAMLGLTLLPPLATGIHRRLLSRVARFRQGSRYRFFLDGYQFPADTDCTGVAASGLFHLGEIGQSAMDDLANELMQAVCPQEGTFVVYWPDSERDHKHDAVACANALYAVKLAGNRDADSANLAYLHDHLQSGRLSEGTRYYPSGETFLWAASRLCYRFPECSLTLGPLLRQAIAGVEPQSALDLAQRIIAADHLGLQEHQATRRAKLAEWQQPDGSWPAYGLFRLGRFPIYFGSAFLTTVFALRALVGAGNG